jgi:nitrite reductase/ring-hydroxylating ferredoxin subunit
VTSTLTVGVDELAAHGRVRLVCGERAVLVSWVDGAAYAVSDACPHRATSLVDGVLRDGVVTCPGHLWQFDVRTGARHDTVGEPLDTYPVQVDGDLVEVTLPDEVAPPSLREVLLAHARAGLR